MIQARERERGVMNKLRGGENNMEDVRKEGRKEGGFTLIIRQRRWWIRKDKKSYFFFLGLLHYEIVVSYGTCKVVVRAVGVSVCVQDDLCNDIAF